MAVECLEALPAALEAQGLLGAVHLQAQGLSHFRHQVHLFLLCMAAPKRTVHGDVYAGPLRCRCCTWTFGGMRAMRRW